MYTKFFSNKKTMAYLGLFFVVFMWGTAPLITQYFYKYYSPSIRLAFTETILFFTYLALSAKHLKNFNREYIKVGIPTGFFLALANITQKIGLMYTTPARYAFLENLSCITVPVLMFFIAKKKPGFMTILSCITCLVGVFVLNGISFSDSSWGIGEILCAASGLLYGFNIALTGVFAKKFHAPMYLATQSVVGITVSLAFAISLNFITMTNAEGVVVPIEKILFTMDFGLILFTIVYSIIAVAFCWIIRTNSMKHIDPTAVAIIMPFSAVVTGILSVLTGSDVLNLNLVFGAILGVAAVMMSSLDDIKKK